MMIIMMMKIIIIEILIPV